MTREESEKQLAEKRAERLKELKKLKPITFEELEETVKKWFLIADFGLLRLHTAMPIIHMRTTKPVWMFLVAPPGSGKTQLMEALMDLDVVYPISSLTPQTFMSGMNNSKTDASLLPLVTNKVMVFKEWTSIMSMKYEAKREIMAQLREIWDGRMNKMFGNGIARNWEGRVSMYAGTTEMVDMDQEMFASLGERFLYYRPIQPDDKELARIAARNTNKAELMTKELKNAFFAYFQGFKGEILDEIELSSETIERIIDIASLAVTARSAVVRDFGFSRDVSFIPDPEAPTRMTQALMSILQALMIIRKTKEVCEEDMKIVFKVALDSIPKKRRLVLRVLAKYGKLKTDELALAIGYPTGTINNVFQDVALLGREDKKLIRRIKEGNSNTWLISPPVQELLIKYDNVEIEKIEESELLEKIKEVFGEAVKESDAEQSPFDV